MANNTNMIDTIFTEYKNNNMIINSALKYRFSYNGYNTDVFYTQKDGLQNQLLLAITVNNVTYITTLYFHKKDNEYCMQFYLPNELYEQLQFSLLYVDGHCAVTPYFKKMINHIMENQPISVRHRDELRNYQNYVYEDEKNYLRKDLKGESTGDAVFDQLISREDVIYTAHTAFYTDRAIFNMIETTVENLWEYGQTGSCAHELP